MVVQWLSGVCFEVVGWLCGFVVFGGGAVVVCWLFSGCGCLVIVQWLSGGCGCFVVSLVVVLVVVWWLFGGCAVVVWWLFFVWLFGDGF